MMMMMMTKKINYLFIKVIKNSIINYIKDLYLHIINFLQMDENNFWRENIFVMIESNLLGIEVRVHKCLCGVQFRGVGED